MGVLRFKLQQPALLPHDVLSRVYMTGLEDVAWPSVAARQDGLLVIERDVQDSGRVHVPCRIGDGFHLLTTTNLVERERPYALEVELARGAIHLLRSQASAWQSAGLVVSTDFESALRDATSLLAQAVTSADEAAAAQLAVSTIEKANRLIDWLGRSYVEQALNVRRRSSPQLATLLAVDLGRSRLGAAEAGPVSDTFNTAVVPLGWRHIEASAGGREWSTADAQIHWCQKHGLKICGGPLIEFGASGIPDWAYLFEGRFDELVDIMVDHVQAVVNRYRGQVHLWQVISRVNVPDVLSLDDEQRLRIAVRLLEAVRAIDPRTPTVASFDRPWGEYMARQPVEFAPLHFADALVRADLGLAGLGLEINAEYFPHGTMRHNLLDYSRQLDRWSLLGLPLLISLTTPSARGPAGASPPPVEADPTGASLQTQCRWVETYVPMMLAKNCVQIIAWNQLRDRDPHEFPHSGLLDHDGRAKPALAALAEIRRNYLA